MSTNTSKSPSADAQPLFLRDIQLAPLIGLSVAFLRKDRRTARVIPFLRTGVDGRVLYDLETVRQALLALTVGGQSKRPRRTSSSGS